MEAEFITGSSDPNDYGQFIEDASLYRDILPQPYRLIDKILAEFFNKVWCNISSREAACQYEAGRYKPPFLLHSNQIKIQSSANCLTMSSDEKLIIVGLNNGLTVLDAESHAILCVWSDAEVSIMHISVTLLSEYCYLIATVDSKGIPRLFCVNQVEVFLMAALDRMHQDSNELARQSTVCSASHLSEFLAVNFGDEKLEVYELPRYAWMKEIDKALQQKQRIESSSVEASGDPVKEFTFSKPALLMKILPSTEVKASSSLTGLKGLSPVGRVCVGSTTSTIMSQHYLTACQKEFEEKYQPACVPKSALATTMSTPGLPNFHFLISPEKNSCIDDTAKSKGDNSNIDKSIVVWWSNRSFIQLYSLSKVVSKSSELRSVCDWPTSCSVTASAVSPCSFLVSFTLTNCNVIIWNRKTGHRSVAHIDGATEIIQLEYLSKCCCSGSCYCELPRLGHSTYLLARCSSGRVFQLYVVSGQDETVVTDISPEILDSSDTPIYMKLLKTHQTLSLMRQQNGRIHVYDMSSKLSLCEALLPLSYSQFITDRKDSTTVAVSCSTQTIFALGKNDDFYGRHVPDAVDEMLGDDNTDLPSSNQFRDPGKKENEGGVTTVEQTAAGLKEMRPSSSATKMNEPKAKESLKNKQAGESELNDNVNTAKMSVEGLWTYTASNSFEECLEEAAQYDAEAVHDDIKALESSLKHKPSHPCSVFVYSIADILGDQCVHSAPDESEGVRSESSLEVIVDSALKLRICGQEERKLRLHNTWFSLTENIAS